MNRERKLTIALTKIRKVNPFLGTLCLHVEHRIDERIPTAGTDGRTIWYNPDFIDECRLDEIGGVVLHELLHAALLHNPRRGTRDPELWNIAADIVVNGIVLQESWVKLPFDPVIDRKHEHLRVEEIYSLLTRNMKKENFLPRAWMDLSLPEGLKNRGASDALGSGGLESHWKQAWRQAQVVHQMSGSPMGSNLKRLLREVTVPQVDWRTMLWQYMVRTPNDFGGWDRRYVHRGMYLETLQGESLGVFVCIDTSGSINGELLDQFLTEIKAILNAYPHVEADLYYADAALYGPYEVKSEAAIPSPKGGGGTSFEPFFDELKRRHDGGQRVAIYLTDGYGVYPKQAPVEDTLWVVPDGGLESRKFPFGEVARIQAA